MNTKGTVKVEEFVPTRHAEIRMAQRNLSLESVYFVLEHGQRVHRAGAIFYFLGKRNIPRDKCSDQEYARLEGTIVVTSREMPLIITVYRNRSGGLRHIKRKLSRDCKRQ